MKARHPKLQADERLLVEAYRSMAPRTRRKALEWFRFHTQYDGSLIVGRKLVALLTASVGSRAGGAR